MDLRDIPEGQVARAELLSKVAHFPTQTPIKKTQKPFKPAQKPGLSAVDALSDSQEHALLRIKEDLERLDKAIIARQEFAGSQHLSVDFAGFDRMRMEMGMMIKNLEDAYAKSWHARAAGFVKSRAA
ncbi:hypothetical protein [Janthinobacterium sp. B9-8]|uniref:hypothetical protein n=1 Tax=Janthinobacterium sp. B9-8 TaxID=1236179 RepID=UPI00061D18CF|nr:hypothetical protein [Janthinobacterium sp. B9-8]AMC34244.1 hypothetical protein VN23_06355 [Janthinobacterium sp. B9-8]